MDKYTKTNGGLEINTLDFGILLFPVKNISSLFYKVNFALKQCDFTVKPNLPTRSKCWQLGIIY